MSQLGDSSQRCDDSGTSASMRSDVASQSSNNRVVKKLKHDLNGSTVGEGSTRSSTELGVLARDLVSIGYKKWTDVPMLTKDKIWEKFKENYIFLDGQRDLHIKRAGISWKARKTALRKKHLDGKPQERWLESMPKTGVSPEDWAAFVENEKSVNHVELCSRNKDIKKNSPSHQSYTGRAGYARYAYNYLVQHGRRPMRVELWLYTHKRRSGGYSPEDEELARKFEGLLEIMRQNNQVETLNSGPIFDHYGVDKNGRTRLVGSNISRTSLLASSFARRLLEQVEAEESELEKNMKELTKSNEEMIFKMNELLARTTVNNDQRPSQPCPSNSFLRSRSRSRPSGPLIHEIHDYTYDDPMPVKILSQDNDVVAYGRRCQPGSVHIVNGHVLGIREVQVLIDNIVDGEYGIWGGGQNGLKKMGEVKVGQSLFWHDDFLRGDINDDDEY